MIIADISIPSQIKLLGQLLLSDGAFGIYVEDNYAYIAGLDAGFIIVDISNPGLPYKVSSFGVEWAALNVDVQNDIACVACGYGGLYILDISDPYNPQHLGLIDSHNTWAYDAKIDGNYAYMAYSLYIGGGGLKVIDISTPTNPWVVEDLASGSSFRRMDYDSGYVFIAAGDGGMFIVDVTTPSFPGFIGGWYQGRGENISYFNEKIYLSGAKEGLRIFHAADLYFPNLICTYPTYSASQDVAVAGGYAYVVEQPSGLKAVDISNPASPMVTFSSQFYYEGNGYGGVSSGVSVIDNRLYVSDFANLEGGDHDFRIYGLDNPAKPESLGIYNAMIMGIRGHWVRNDIAYLSNSGCLLVLDIKNPEDISLAYTLYGDWESAAGMDLVENYLYLGTRETGLRILDVSNEAWPEIIGGFDTEGETFTAQYHNGLVYLADYGQGLRIINVDDPENPYEVGYFLENYEDCRDVAFIDKPDYSYAIVGFDNQIVAVDITDPANPFEVGYYDTGDPRRLLTCGDTVFVADRDYGLYILKFEAQVDIAGDENKAVPDDFFIANSYPNPFNSAAIIEFTLPASGWVSVDIFDILGRIIACPFEGNAEAGINSVTWNGRDFSGSVVSSGVYFYRITANERTTTNRMVLIK